MEVNVPWLIAGHANYTEFGYFKITYQYRNLISGCPRVQEFEAPHIRTAGNGKFELHVAQFSYYFVISVHLAADIEKQGCGPIS